MAAVLAAVLCRGSRSVDSNWLKQDARGYKCLSKLDFPQKQGEGRKRSENLW